MVLAIDEHIKWELIHRIIKHKWENKNQLVCFNSKGKTKFSTSEILEINEKSNLAFQKFSNIIHQIPRASVFDEKTDEFMWKEYQKIFYYGSIAQQKHAAISSFEKDPAFADKEARYMTFREAYEDLELAYMEALNSNAGNEHINDIKHKLKAKAVAWEEKGCKTEIERKYNDYFSKSNFSYSSLWSRWKTKALEADVAGFTGPFSRFGDFNADFSTLLNENNWKTTAVKYGMLNHLKTMKISETNDDIKHLIANISSIKFKYQIIPIERDWFSKEVFESDFWKWHTSYNGGVIARGEITNGTLTGSLPGYISTLYFLKDIEFRGRSNPVFDLLEWVGGMFSELPYETFIPTDKDEYFLAGFNATIVPLCPNPNPNLEFTN